MEEQTLNLIEGAVSSIIFQNEENGYTILRLEAGQGEVTVVGCMPGVAPGESLSVRGSWVRHPSYGEQFKAESIERRLPRGVKEVFHYLSSGVVKGVGQSTARRIVEEFGEDALNILEEEPEKLTKIKGITLKRAQAMSQAFRQQMGMRRLLEFLSAHGLPVQLGTALYRQWGGAALDVIRSNPYLLVSEELPPSSSVLLKPFSRATSKLSPFAFLLIRAANSANSCSRSNSAWIPSRSCSRTEVAISFSSSSVSWSNMSKSSISS